MFRAWRGSKTPSSSGPSGPSTTPEPVVTEVRRLVGNRQYEAATLIAYGRILDDLQRAYSVTFAPGWTLPEILRFGFDERMRELAGPVSRLYEMYRPLRFGAPPRDADTEPLVEIVETIYGKYPMYRLYHRRGPELGPSPADGATPGSGGEDARGSAR
jgi:hypothetical protein